MSTTKEEPTNQRKQAFYDSHNSYKINLDKYKNISDPILQQKERYVINIIILFIYYYILERKRIQISCRNK